MEVNGNLICLCVLSYLGCKSVTIYCFSDKLSYKCETPQPGVLQTWLRSIAHVLCVYLFNDVFDSLFYPLVSVKCASHCQLGFWPWTSCWPFPRSDDCDSHKLRHVLAWSCDSFHFCSWLWSPLCFAYFNCKCIWSVRHNVWQDFFLLLKQKVADVFQLLHLLYHFLLIITGERDQQFMFIQHVFHITPVIFRSYIFKYFGTIWHILCWCTVCPQKPNITFYLGCKYRCDVLSVDDFFKLCIFPLPIFIGEQKCLALDLSFSL